MLGYLTQTGADTGALFSGARHAPEPLTDAERGAVREAAGAPRPVRLDFPDWLEEHLSDVADASLDALRNRAAVDLRVNTLKADPTTVRAALAEEGIGTEPVPDRSSDRCGSETDSFTRRQRLWTEREATCFIAPVDRLAGRSGR